MSQPFDLSQFPDLPPEVVKAVSALQFELSVERAARLHEQAVGAEKDAFITELKALIEKLEGQVGQYRHAKFGPKSEKLDPAQLELALEDLETAIAETQAQIAAVEDKIAASATDPRKAAPRAPRKARALPEHLPRTLRVIEPDSIVWSPLERHWSERQWPRGCGDAVAATWCGSARQRRVRKRSGGPFPRRWADRLDYIPARYQVIVTIRPKYACPPIG
jgi:transposase